MKKIITLFTICIMVIGFSGCRNEVVQKDGFYVLPDLTGLNRSEIEIYFEDFNVVLSFSEVSDSNEFNEGLFAGYDNNYEIGDHFYNRSNIDVLIYGDSLSGDGIFYPIDMIYDGPLLDNNYENINPIEPRGGYFEVDLFYCTDGDTAVFDYPVEIYNAILSSSKSSRFLNMDTEETYNGGEEEWGKPASVYTCDLLTTAESIILQTDPGDALTGTYGRLLAWIWVKLPNETEYHLLNYMVVKQGLAQVKYEFGAGLELENNELTYNEWMHLAEDYALEKNLGQWGNLKDYYWDYENNEPNFIKWH